MWRYKYLHLQALAFGEEMSSHCHWNISVAVNKMYIVIDLSRCILTYVNIESFYFYTDDEEMDEAKGGEGRRRES